MNTPWFASAVWTWVGQCTAILALGATISYLWKSRPARAHRLLFLAVLACFVIPLMSQTVRNLGWGVFKPAPTTRILPNDRAVRPMIPVTVPEDLQATAPTTLAPATRMRGGQAVENGPGVPSSFTLPKPSIRWQNLVLTLWAGLSGLMLVRLLVCMGRELRVLWKSTPMRSGGMIQQLEEARRRMGLRSLPKVFLSDQVRCPVVYGWGGEPALVLPQSITQNAVPETWQGILCHELAHWKRGDHWASVASELLFCLLPWHPLVWWVKRKLALVGELACDHWVVASGHPADTYAESLLMQLPQQEAALALPAVRLRKHLEIRIGYLMAEPSGDPNPGRRWALTVSLTMLGLTTVLALAQAQPDKRENAKPTVADVGASLTNGSAATPQIANTPPVEFDAAANFSPTNNPNGAWSYGWMPADSLDFTLYTKRSTCYTNTDTPQGFNEWTGAFTPDLFFPEFTEPHVLFNPHANPVEIARARMAPRRLTSHPGKMGERSAVRWTAPTSGPIELAAAFEGLDIPFGATTDASVYHNRSLLFVGDVEGYDKASRITFATNLIVAAGDTIDFVVGCGSDRAYFRDTTQVDATILAGLREPRALAPAAAVTNKPIALIEKRSLEDTSKVPVAETDHAVEGTSETSSSSFKPSSAPGRFDAATDFSPTKNPNGAWSYGWMPADTLDFTPYAIMHKPWGLNEWTGEFTPDPILPVFTEPHVLFNSATNQFRMADARLAPRRLTSHPGKSGERSVIRWTAPTSGRFQIVAAFEGRDPPFGATTDASVYHNRGQIFAGDVTGYDQASRISFNTKLNVTAGDTIDFVVGCGSDHAYFRDSTQVDAAIIDLTTARVTKLRQASSLSANMPKKDLGEVELSRYTPTHVALGAGKECVITTIVFADGNLQMDLAVETKTADGKNERLDQARLTAPPGQQCAISLGGMMISLMPKLNISTKYVPSSTQPTPQQVQQLTQVTESFAQVKTRPFSLEDFSQAIEARVGTNLDNLSESERLKLFACINRFYACYSSGHYDDFKLFRLHLPFTVSEGLASVVKTIAAQKGVELNSDEDTLRFAWNYYNGTNKIGQVSEEHIILSVVKRQDLGAVLRQPSVGKSPGLGASCWEGAVVYQPTPAELLKKDGSLRFFTLEVIVRFSPQVGGPATPLVLMGYWDPTRNDWMPYALCTVLHVGSYDTMF